MLYTPATIAYLKRHYNIDRTSTQIAQHLGTTPENLKQRVYKLRKMGYVFASNGSPVGHVREAKRADGSTYTMLKTEEGFKYVQKGRREPKWKEGDIRVQDRNGRNESYRKEGNKWVYVRKEGAQRKRAASSPKTGATTKDTPHGTPNKGKPALIRKTPARPPMYTDKNPSNMKNIAKHEEQVKAGWRTVPIGKGLWAFRPPEKIQQTV